MPSLPLFLGFQLCLVVRNPFSSVTLAGYRALRTKATRGFSTQLQSHSPGQRRAGVEIEDDPIGMLDVVDGGVPGMPFNGIHFDEA